MIHVILTILKILGIVLTALLLLVILLLAVILFVPVRYTVNMDYHGRLHADVNASWLLKLLRFKAVYDEQGLDYKLKLLWINLMDSSVKDKPSKPKKEKKPKKSKDAKPKKKSKKDKNKHKEISEEPKESATSSESMDSRANIQSEALSDGADKDVYGGYEDNTDSQIQPKENPVVKFFKKLRDTIKNSYYKTAGFKEKAVQKAEEIRDFINDETNREFVLFMKNQLVIILSHIIPRKYNIKIRFGADSPDVTGKVTGAVSVVMAFLRREPKKHRGTFEYIPVFDEKALDADVFMKGRIRICSVLRVLWRVYKNDSFRRLILKK